MNAITGEREASSRPSALSARNVPTGSRSPSPHDSRLRIRSGSGVPYPSYVRWSNDAYTRHRLIMHSPNNVRALGWLNARGGLRRSEVGYDSDMTIAFIVLATIVLIVAIVMVVQRRGKANANALRAQAVEHRAEAKAAQIEAAHQETHAEAMADTARRNQAIADDERRAATVKREVADDLNIRADQIDPDVPQHQ